MVFEMERVEKAGGERIRRNEREEEEEEENEETNWESEIPRMVLRVLLVEADDSTRHVVTALLRKCGYRVSAVSDGLAAWETLKDKDRRIDLVLTEMDLPSISGFALLSLVMEHDVCREIPVIMMSSQDSVGLVFKCMLKGAADYLIKPLRRNELRNLWHHVWRRSAVFQKQVPQNSASQGQNPETGFEADAPNAKGCSEKGSDSQSSCTTRYLEAESEKVPNMQDVSEPKSVSASKVMTTNDDKLDEEDLVMNTSESRDKSNLFKPEVSSCKRAFKSTVMRLEEDNICAKRAKRDESVHTNGITEVQSCYDEMVSRSSEAANLIGGIDDHPRCSRGPSVVDDSRNSVECSPHLELSLRRNLSKGSNSQVTDEGPKLNHSNGSAFSWYNNNSTPQPLFATLPNGSSKSDESSLFNQPSGNSIKASHEQPKAVGQFGESEISTPRAQTFGVPIPVKCRRFDQPSSQPYGQFFPSLFDVQSNLESPHEKTPYEANNTLSHPDDPEIHPSEETSNHKSIDATKRDHDHFELVEDVKPSSLDDGESNIGNACYGGSDETATSFEALEADMKTSIAPTTQFLDDIGGEASHEKFRGMDSVWINQREAALAKFRIKRKDRCFEKKVRYQSRKKLAEQRPRVKGQFVRQTAN